MTQEIKLKGRLTPYIIDIKKESCPPDELLKAIGDTLYSEMKNRGLWSPSWLGYDGEQWEDNFEEFQKLVQFFYYTSIITRLNSLQAYAKKGRNIDGYVIRNIKNDLTREQKKWDKVGWAVYENLNCSVMCLIEVGIIEIYREVKNWQTKVHQQALLAFAPCHSITLPDEKLMLEALGKSALFRNTSLLTRLAKKDTQLKEPLCEMICQLRKSNISCFQFYSLIEPMKRVVRSFTDNRITIFLEDSKINPVDEETEPDGQEMASKEEFVMLSEPDEIYLSDFCDEIRAAIKNLKKYRLRRKRFYAILKVRQEAIEQQITPLSLEELARRFRVCVNIEERKQQEWARRLGVTINEFKQVQQTQPLEKQAECLRISASKLNNETKRPFSMEEIANILEVSVEELETIKQNVELPSQQKLGKLLKCAAGTINADMEILRELAKQVEEKKDWGKATLCLAVKMLK